MIDTNQVNQAIQSAAEIKQAVAPNWPAICAAAIWLRADLRNVIDYAIAHGGVVMMVKKFFWNPSAIKAGIILMGLSLGCGCAAYNHTPFYFPNSWNATVSTDRTGLTTFYVGVSGPLKPQ